MKQFLTVLVAFLSIVCFIGLHPAFATHITSASDPALSGATVIDFQSQTIGTYTSLTIGNVTFTALDNNLTINSDFAGSYNTTGQSLDNRDYTNNGFTDLKISFLSSTSAFGFNWGAVDNQWELKAYDSSNNLLDTFDLPIIGSSNAGDFYGIAASNISYATLDNISGSYDWVFVDNFSYVGGSTSVPEPATMILLGFGLFGFGLFGRKIKE